MKAGGLPSDRVRLAVEAFDTTVACSGLDVAENPLGVLRDRPGQLREWRQAAATSPAEPLMEPLPSTLTWRLSSAAIRASWRR